MKQNEWFDATVGDGKVYARYNGKRKFEFISNMWLDTCEGDEGWPDKEYCVRHNEIDMNDYDDNDLECAASIYYEDLADMRRKISEYGDQTELDFELAETIFNYLNMSDDSIDGMFTEQESIDYINNYIKEI